MDTPAPSVKAPRKARVNKKVIEKKSSALQTLVVEYVHVDSITPNKYNPNRQSERDFELLCRSMQEDGFTQPIVCMKSNREIVDGEHRWRAAQKLGLEQIPVVFVDMTEEQRRIATLRHNRARGSEDIELSAQVLRDLRELGALDWAQDSLMLDTVELDRLLNDIPAPEALAAPEYSEAWEPGQATSESSDRPNDQVASSQAAAEALRTQEQRIANAKTAEEKAAAQRDTAVFRLALIFAGEEATLVKSVLGDKPADRLLELCRVAKE